MPPKQASATNDVTYLDAVSQALMAEMEDDESVFIIGEDVGQFGGAFKVTKGFLDKFGSRRVVDTPIAETGFTGLAAGASLVVRSTDEVEAEQLLAARRLALPAFERLGTVLIAGCRDATAARQLGFVPVHGLGAALEMAHGWRDRPPRIAFLLAPPYFPIRTTE
jgi:hypothetical protein